MFHDKKGYFVTLLVALALAPNALLGSPPVVHPTQTISIEPSGVATWHELVEWARTHPDYGATDRRVTPYPIGNSHRPFPADAGLGREPESVGPQLDARESASVETVSLGVQLNFEAPLAARGESR